MESANDSRIKGNQAFKENELDIAIKYYNDAILKYPANNPDLALTYANRAFCYLKQVFLGMISCKFCLLLESFYRCH